MCRVANRTIKRLGPAGELIAFHLDRLGPTRIAKGEVMAKRQVSSQAVRYVRGENSFRIAAEATPEQVCEWAEDWYKLWTLEVCGGNRRVERFIDCCSRLAAVAELQKLNAAPLLTFIREMGDVRLFGRIPAKSDSHLGEAQDVVERVDSWAKGQISEEKAAISASLCVKVEGKPQTLPKYLTSWREILIALEFKNNREDKQKVSRLNKSYSGPIEIPGQGKQPFVDKAKLLDWWAGLEAKVKEGRQRKLDAQATVANRHDFGREGEVTPGISGGIKKRRRDRNP